MQIKKCRWHRQDGSHGRTVEGYPPLAILDSEISYWTACVAEIDGDIYSRWCDAVGKRMKEYGSGPTAKGTWIGPFDSVEDAMAAITTLLALEGVELLFTETKGESK